MTTPTITIDLNVKCPRCGKKGATRTPTGKVNVCLKCYVKALRAGEFDQVLGFGLRSGECGQP